MTQRPLVPRLLVPRLLTRPLLASLFATVLVVGLAGCGDDDDTTATGDDGTTTDDGGTGAYDYGSTSSGGSADADAPEGTIVAVDYSLSDITVLPGEPIVMKNDGEETHTATADNDEFDLGEVEPGATSDPGTAPVEPGTYAFHCQIHASMQATLTVEG